MLAVDAGMRRRHESLLIVGPLTGPVNGANKITSAVLAMTQLKGGDNPELSIFGITTSGISTHGRVVYHTSRVVQHLATIAIIARRRCLGQVTMYVGGAGGFGLWYQCAIIKFAKLLHARVYFHHHSYNYLSGGGVLSVRVLTGALDASDGHILLSEAMRNEFQRLYGGRAGNYVLSNANFIDPTEGPAPNRPDVYRLVHIGNLSREKGFFEVAHAFRYFVDRGMSVGLTVAGPTDDRDIYTEIRQLSRDYPGLFEYLGPCGNGEVSQILDRSHLFLFASTYRNEAQPLVVLEALSRGVPVIASRRGSLGELLPSSWLMSDTAQLVAAIDQMRDRNWSSMSTLASRLFMDSRASEWQAANLVNVLIAHAIPGGSSQRSEMR